MVYDELWASNWLACRKVLRGTTMVPHPLTGYLEPKCGKGFTSWKKKLFIERFRICASLAGVAESIPIHSQTVYDAMALDKKFRDDVNACNLIPDRPKRLNKALVGHPFQEQARLVDDLLTKAQKYGPNNPKQ